MLVMVLLIMNILLHYKLYFYVHNTAVGGSDDNRDIEQEDECNLTILQIIITLSATDNDVAGGEVGYDDNVDDSVVADFKMMSIMLLMLTSNR